VIIVTCAGIENHTRVCYDGVNSSRENFVTRKSMGAMKIIVSKYRKLGGVAALTLLLIAISGFTVTGLHGQPALTAAPRQLTNVIQNGSFEDNPTSSIATHWQPYDNGSAHYGWYLEQWPEAVHSGKSSQLMEIFEVSKPNRVMAIYQTVPVQPHANYQLTFQALMRSDAPVELRNQGDYAMAWGVDDSGRSKYHRVETWHNMPLTEQLRIGSNGPSNDNTRLYFEIITATIFTGNADTISLFIRGEKVTHTGTEVNFNIDDVSLVGPYPVAPPAVVGATAEPAAAESPPAADPAMPSAGGVLSQTVSGGTLALGGLVLSVLGVGAVVGLLKRKNWPWN
jgi:hypothetical protein